MPDHISRSSVMFAGVIAVAVMAIALLVIGLTSSVSTGYRVGPYAGFGSGLTAVNVGVMLGVAAGSLALHLWHMKDNARQRRERSEDAARIMNEVERLHSEDVAQIMNEIIGLKDTLDVVVRQLATQNEAFADEIGQQRRRGN